jgi:hypothetical protein
VLAQTPPQDKSNGYEEAADSFMSTRNPHIGVATVRGNGVRRLRPVPQSSILGVAMVCPISQVLIEEGFTVYGIDASTKLTSAFRKRFPNAHAECAAVEDSEFFPRTFDGVVAWGLETWRVWGCFEIGCLRSGDVLFADGARNAGSLGRASSIWLSDGFLNRARSIPFLTLASPPLIRDENRMR